MAHVVMVDTPGMTAELYDKSAEMMGLVGRLPEGCVAHIAGPGPEGWRIVAVWESLEKAQQFAATTLQRQPCLADPGRSGEGEQACIIQKPSHFAYLGAAPDELGQTVRYIAAHRGCGSPAGLSCRYLFRRGWCGESTWRNC